MTINIPTDYSDVTISQLMRWEKALQDNNELLLEFQLVSIFCDIPLTETIKIPQDEFTEIVDIISKLQDTPQPFKRRFTLNGIEYGFIPNLDEMETGEYIDIGTYFDTDPLRLMAVLFRPIKRKQKDLYAIADYKGTEETYMLMANAPASELLGAKVFFWNLATELLKHIPTYLQKNLTTEQAGLLERNGVGIFQLMQSLEAITSNMNEFTNLKFSNS
jgi:hypothetical protein